MNQQSALDTFRKLTQMGLKVEVVNEYNDKTNENPYYYQSFGFSEESIELAFTDSQNDDEYIRTLLQVEVG